MHPFPSCVKADARTDKDRRRGKENAAARGSIHQAPQNDSDQDGHDDQPPQNPDLPQACRDRWLWVVCSDAVASGGAAGGVFDPIFGLRLCHWRPHF